MDLRVGTDIVRIDRFADLGRDDPLVQRIFTAQEREYAFSKHDPEQHLAARYAVKEALYKAIGREDLGLCDIEIVVGDDGDPSAVLADGDLEADISMAHGEADAVAMVLVRPGNT